MAVHILILGRRLGWRSTGARHTTRDAAAYVTNVIPFHDVVVLDILRCILLRHLAVPVAIEVLLSERPTRLGRA